MRISELARQGGVPVATVKYYLREGLLPPGRATAATQAEYGEAHARRLRLVRALVHVGGLSVAAVRDVLAAVDAGGPDAAATAVATAHAHLPPEPDDSDETPAVQALTTLGWRHEPGTAPVRQLARALRAVAAVGLPATPEGLAVYADAALAVARHDVGGVPRGSAEEAVEYAVAGTVLYEAVLLSLRRCAHVHVAHGAVPAPPPP